MMLFSDFKMLFLSIAGVLFFSTGGGAEMSDKVSAMTFEIQNEGKTKNIVEIDIQQQQQEQREGGGGGNIEISLIEQQQYNPAATTCSEANCNSHPETGLFVDYTTCTEGDDGTAICGCAYSEYGDVYPNCLGPKQNCTTGGSYFSGSRCIQSFCYNWCETISITDTCLAGTDNGECCDTSGCTYLVCNPNYRESGSETQCTCSQGDLYHIDLTDNGSQYKPASGCANVP